jgi:hypothetical protein
LSCMLGNFWFCVVAAICPLLCALPWVAATAGSLLVPPTPPLMYPCRLEEGYIPPAAAVGRSVAIGDQWSSSVAIGDMWSRSMEQQHNAYM